MLCFAKAHGGVSIVGDPDQSIYGWRAAGKHPRGDSDPPEVENLHKMTREFENVQAIYLEENYRSTGSILAASHSIVSQGGKGREGTDNRQEAHPEEAVHIASPEHACDAQVV